MANPKACHSLRDFLQVLEAQDALQRIGVAVSPDLEMTEFSRRVLQQQGPALLFEAPQGYNLPVLCNLFGTVDRIALAMGNQADALSHLRSIGTMLAALKSPEPPAGLIDAMSYIPRYSRVMHMAPKVANTGPCREVVYDRVDLATLPIQRCWPLDVAPLITWGLVVTRGGDRGKRLNLGIYRQQVIDSNRVIMRWLAHRGGALDYQRHRRNHPDEPYPVAVVLGADPATTLAAVTPIPDSLSEYQFAGLLRGARSQLIKGAHDLLLPASSEIVLEGYIYPDDEAEEGPFGDHTGYYNEVARFPVFTIERITSRDKPIYHSTYTGKPPDEPAMLGVALNEVFVPLLQQQFSEITDFYLPPEGCSYRIALVAINKQYPGHARRICFGIWSYLRQFMYTKTIIITDSDINIRDWAEVMWAISTRVDAERDTLIVNNTPIDYLDFASPVAGLGSKMAIDATNKWPGEVHREWGTAITMTPEVIERVDALFQHIGWPNTSDKR